MEEIGLVVLVLLSGVYFSLLISSFLNWKSKTNCDHITEGDSDSVSVVIAFKDEQEGVLQLLESLVLQDYNNFNVILVNDHSLDDSVDLVKGFQDDRVSLYHLPKGETGKKLALSFGVKKSTSKFILFTDADCVLNPTWISSMVGTAKTNGANWLGGAVSYKGGSGLSSFFQKLESAYLVMISSFAITKQKPTTCNGANILIEKSVFEDVNGFDDIMQTPSGDDELLMQKIFVQTDNRLSFNYDLSSTVRTGVATSWSELINQRVRWASKLRYNLLGFNKALSALIFLFHMSCVLGLFLFPKVVLIVLFVRLIIEWLGGYLFLSRQGERFKFHYFLISFFVYPLYVIFMAVLTQLKSFSWKGRKF